MTRKYIPAREVMDEWLKDPKQTARKGSFLRGCCRNVL